MSDRLVQRAARQVMRDGTDLLPPRAYEGLPVARRRGLARSVAGEVNLRNVRPTPRLTIIGSKIGGARHISLLTFADRVVVQALADLARPAVERSVGPRESRRDNDKWASFDHDALRSDPRYILLADVASFYGSIDGTRVAEVLAPWGVPDIVTEVLPTFLRGLMGDAGGLPVDCAASDFFSSVIMAPVDRAMASPDWTYLRLCDDFRVGAADRSSAEAAFDLLRDELAGLGLRLNEFKTEILSVADYRARLIEPRAALRRELMRGISGRLVRMRPDRAVNVVLRDRMAALDLDACVRTIERELDRPDDEPLRWPNDIGNIRLEWSFRALGAARSPIGVGLATAAYERFPFLVPTIPKYLAAVAASPKGDVAVEVVEEMFQSPAVGDSTRHAWLYFSVRGAASLPQSLVARATEAANDAVEDPVVRIEAARLSATAGGIDQDTLDGLRETVSSHFVLELDEIARAVPTVAPRASRLRA